MGSARHSPVPVSLDGCSVQGNLITSHLSVVSKIYNILSSITVRSTYPYRSRADFYFHRCRRFSGHPPPYRGYSIAHTSRRRLRFTPLSDTILDKTTMVKLYNISNQPITHNQATTRKPTTTKKTSVTSASTSSADRCLRVLVLLPEQICRSSM